jgi:hypothetical protein
MLDLQLNYDPNMTIGDHLASETFDPTTAAERLRRGSIPVNLVQISEISTNFRDAVINDLITNTGSGEAKDRALQLLAAAVASTPNGMDNTIRAYSEYLAPLSFAWGETVLATRTILRNKPGKAGAFINTVASALSKKMDVATFNNLLMNSTASAKDIVELERAQGKY